MTRRVTSFMETGLLHDFFENPYQVKNIIFTWRGGCKMSMSDGGELGVADG